MNSNNNLKLSFKNGQWIATIANLSFANSNLHGILVNEQSETTLNAELQKVENDIELIKGVLILKEHFGASVQIIRESENDDDAMLQLINEFKINKDQAKYFINQELSLIKNVDYNHTKEVLETYVLFLKSILEKY